MVPRAAMSCDRRARALLEERRRERLAGIDQVDAVVRHAALAAGGLAVPMSMPR